MAFVLADDETLARDLWPGDKGRLLGDAGSISTLPKSRVVPREYEDLCRWLCVDPCSIDAPVAVWVQPQEGEEHDRLEATIRVQGFVERIAFGMLGTWNGTPQGAPRAMQSLTLVSGGCTEAFSPQLHTLQNVSELVQKLLSRDVICPDLQDGKIVARRRVFAKVRPTDSEVASYPVPFAEDPAGRTRKMERMWAIRHRIDAGAQDNDGRLRRVNPLVIRVGDFVDVALTVQVVSLRLPRGRQGVQMMFAPQAIVRLVSSDEAAMMLKTIADENAFLHEQDEEVEEVAVRKNTGFAFEDGEEMVE